MRTLKKILALVLALVMSLSLMATAGAASFQDVTDDNPYKTAIDVLTELKVVKGYGDGNFQPNGQLTRAEAAVLVYRIATGDVEDKYLDNYTFMQQSKFTDLEGYNWAKGYINYCQNAGIVVGTDATHFNPGGKVTGYQLLVMLLRTLGYGKAGEFADPKGWELQTAAIAEREKITKNVTTGDFGAPAPRAMVAELLFRGLLSETVTYSALTSGGYTKGETLGKRELGLEEIEGVVMANEYASLTSTKTARDGKTEMLVDGKTYTLDTVTNLDDIGENRLAYIQNGAKVLYLADEGNTTEESTNKEKVSAILDRAGIRDGGEQFVNFDEVKTHDSAYRIKYVLKFDDLADATYYAGYINAASGVKYNNSGYATWKMNAEGKYEVTRVITPRATITSVDLLLIEYIFGAADLINKDFTEGEVYVGTQSATDISDVTNDNFKYSYEKFYDEFIDEKDGADIAANENGNWVKVIDNDGDGVADYIFKVIYTVAQVASKKDDTVTLDVKNRTLWNDLSGTACGTDALNNVTSQPVVANDDMDKDDIVYYAIIDGKAQTYKAEMVTVAIEKVDHNKLIATTTDGTEYNQSGVHEHIEDEAYTSGVTNLAGKVKYDLFLDRGGHLAAFIKTDKVGDFKLITDGWYNRLKDSKEFAVKAYNDDEGKTEIVDITTNASLFVNDVTNSNIQNNNWGALKYFGGDNSGLNGALNGNGKDVHTIVAAITEDGTILPVENSSVTGRYSHNIIDLQYTDAAGEDHAAVPTKTAALGAVYYTVESANTKTAYNDEDVENVEVRALDSTVYYVVHPDGVIRSVGYKNAPDVTKAPYKGHVEDIYAVGTRHEADNNLSKTYYTADVVVVELDYYEEAGEIVFVVDDTARDSNVNYRRVALIHKDGSLEEDVRINRSLNTMGYSDNVDGGKRIQPGFYRMYKTNEADTYYLVSMDAKAIRDAGCIAVGQVDLSKWHKDNKYIVTRNWDESTKALTAQNGLGAGVNDYYDVAVVNANTTEGAYDLTDDTKLYKLAYGKNGWQSAGYPVVSDTSDVLSGRVNEVDRYSDYTASREDSIQPDKGRQETWFNYNDVMVFYDGGKAVYTVSFENFVDNTATKDWAQTLWESIIPAKKDNSVSFGTFYGYSFGLDADGNSVTSLPAGKTGTDTITLTYADAVAAVAANNIKDGKNTGLVVKGSGWTSTGGNADVPVPVEGVGPIEVTITKDGKSYTYTLKVDPAHTDYKLKGIDNTLTVDTESDPMTVDIDKTKTMKISQFEELVRKANTALLATGAEITWRFFNDYGEITDADKTGTDLREGEIGYYAAIVTTEAGKEYVYEQKTTPANKRIIVKGDDEITLPDGSKVEIAEPDADGNITVTVHTDNDAIRPIVDVNGTLYGMKPGPAPQVKSLDKVWHLVLTEDQVKDVSVIYVRFQTLGDDAKEILEPGKDDLETAKDAAVKAVDDKAGEQIAALKEALKTETDDAKKAKINAAITAIEAVKAEVAGAENDISKAKDEEAVAAAKKAYLTKIDEAVKNSGVDVKVPYNVTVNVKDDKGAAVTGVAGAVTVNGETATATITIDPTKYEATPASVTADNDAKAEVKDGKLTVTGLKADTVVTITLKTKNTVPPAKTDLPVAVVDETNHEIGVFWSTADKDGTNSYPTVAAVKKNANTGDNGVEFVTVTGLSGDAPKGYTSDNTEWDIKLVKCASVTVDGVLKGYVHAAETDFTADAKDIAAVTTVDVGIKNGAFLAKDTSTATSAAATSSEDGIMTLADQTTDVDVVSAVVFDLGAVGNNIKVEPVGGDETAAWTALTAEDTNYVQKDLRVSVKYEDTNNSHKNLYSVLTINGKEVEGSAQIGAASNGKVSINLGTKKASEFETVAAANEDLGLAEENVGHVVIGLKSNVVKVSIEGTQVSGWYDASESATIKLSAWNSNTAYVAVKTGETKAISSDKVADQANNVDGSTAAITSTITLTSIADAENGVLTLVPAVSVKSTTTAPSSATYTYTYKGTAIKTDEGVTLSSSDTFLPVGAVITLTAGNGAGKRIAVADSHAAVTTAKIVEDGEGVTNTISDDNGEGSTLAYTLTGNTKYGSTRVFTFEVWDGVAEAAIAGIVLDSNGAASEVADDITGLTLETKVKINGTWTTLEGSTDDLTGKMDVQVTITAADDYWINPADITVTFMDSAVEAANIDRTTTAGAVVVTGKITATAVTK